jgi:hypothetical protein
LIVAPIVTQLHRLTPKPGVSQLGCRKKLLYIKEDQTMPAVTTTISQIEGSTAVCTRIRKHELVTDRPAEKGGGNRGAMGGELFVASLGGCFMSNLIAERGCIVANTLKQFMDVEISIG